MNPSATSRAIDLLAIAAHRDDVEQTCGGTLIAMAEKGYRTGVLDLTAGEMGTRGDAATRAREAEEAAREMLLTHRDNLGLPDARLESTLEAKLAIAGKLRELRPRTVILPYWEGRHPDHYRAAELAYEACFLAGLKKLELAGEPHRPAKILYSALYANIRPAFVVDISAQFERRLKALFCYRSQYEDQPTAAGLFPAHQEIEERIRAVARYYGMLIGAKYGEPFIVKEMLRIDDVVKMPVASL
ncbi:MAG: bacillithiol biosynthesis deacetylase BshB1 [Acidobacteria bacterium]|nr:bacillithiol biosynthesis deacetylase BshB1 [Acidobacteriota bacterium]